MGATMSRRDLLRVSGATAGGVMLGGAGFVAPAGATAVRLADEGTPPSQRYTWFSKLPDFNPYESSDKALRYGTMRVTFLGTTGYIPRVTGMANSVFVELGNKEGGQGDSFVFDCGSGVVSKYVEMQIPYSRMSKIFLTHLHGDHMSDLTTIYAFGPSYDRKFPLYVWGPSKSKISDPVNHKIYQDGTTAMLRQLREALRWHTEAFSFLSTGTTTYKPPRYAPQHLTDGYDLVPFEFDWWKGDDPSKPALAYDYDDVKIKHFPAVHDRQGSVSYKLEWNNMSLIFTGDTKPSQYVIDQANDGVDVLIHEIHPAPQLSVYEAGLDPSSPYFWPQVNQLQTVINSSHTPTKAFGYILSQLDTPPRLAIGTHFPSADDTVEGEGLPSWLDEYTKGARADIRHFYPEDRGEVQVAQDELVLDVSTDEITKRRGVITGYAWPPPGRVYAEDELVTPKYHTPDGQSDPYAQLDPDAPVIDPSYYNF